MTKEVKALAELRELIKTRISNRLRAGNLEVPVLPHVATQVLSLTSDPNVSARDFVALLEKDQQLSARLLKIANSPVYAGRVKITSIQRAVVTVGMATLRDLVFSVALGEQVFRSKRFGDSMARVWEHSLAVAYIAQEIARVRRQSAEHAFLAGLIHDIGKPLIIETVERIDRQLGGETAVTEEMLDETMRDFHAPVGGLMAKVWRFSDELQDAIRFHHRYEEAESGQPLAILINVANDFAKALGFDSYAEEPPFDLMERPGIAALGLSKSDIQNLLTTLPKVTRSLIQSFQ
ncbi:MAG: HDOD domain-containing protein [Candidatus Lernaella stagnicola]|nr:HDOD domain-containing protein [Candidatus Lernaella stagnicola]